MESVELFISPSSSSAGAGEQVPLAAHMVQHTEDDGVELAAWQLLAALPGQALPQIPAQGVTHATHGFHPLQQLDHEHCQLSLIQILKKATKTCLKQSKRK